MHTQEDLAIFRSIQTRLHNGHSRVNSYISADRRDALEFDYIGRSGVKTTPVKRAKQLIFMNCESPAIKVPSFSGSRGIEWAELTAIY